MYTAKKFIEVVSNVNVVLKNHSDFERQFLLAKKSYVDSDIISSVDGYNIFMYHPRIFLTSDEKLATALVLLSHCNLQQKQVATVLLCFNSNPKHQQVIIEKLLKFREAFIHEVFVVLEDSMYSKKPFEITSLHADTCR